MDEHEMNAAEKARLAREAVEKEKKQKKKVKRENRQFVLNDILSDFKFTLVILVYDAVALFALVFLLVGLFTINPVISILQEISFYLGIALIIAGACIVSATDWELNGGSFQKIVFIKLGMSIM